MLMTMVLDYSVGERQRNRFFTSRVCVSYTKKIKEGGGLGMLRRIYVCESARLGPTGNACAHTDVPVAAPLQLLSTCFSQRRPLIMTVLHLHCFVFVSYVPWKLQRAFPSRAASLAVISVLMAASAVVNLVCMSLSLASTDLPMVVESSFIAAFRVVSVLVIFLRASEILLLIGVSLSSTNLVVALSRDCVACGRVHSTHCVNLKSTATA